MVASIVRITVAVVAIVGATVGWAYVDPDSFNAVAIPAAEAIESAKAAVLGGAE